MQKKTIREKFEEIHNMSREELLYSFKEDSEKLLVALESLRELNETESSTS